MLKWKKALSLTAAAAVAATALAAALPAWAADAVPDVSGYERLLVASSLTDDFESEIMEFEAPNMTIGYQAGKKREDHKSLVLSPGTATAADAINRTTEKNWLREGIGCTANWKGAEYLEFWAKNETATAVSFIVNLYEGAYSPAIAPVCPWQPSGDYYLEAANGETTKATAANGAVTVPGSFEGIIRMPLAAFTHPSWHTCGEGCGAADKIDLSVVRVDLQNVAKQFPTTIALDDIAVIGADLDEVVNLNVAEQKRMQLHGFEAYENDGFANDGNYSESFVLNYDEENKSKGAYAYYADKQEDIDGYGGFHFATFPKPGEVTAGHTNDWTGAEAIGLWVKNTGEAKNLGFNFYENDGTEARGAGEVWQIKGMPNDPNMFPNCYYLEDKDGNVTKHTLTKLTIPANFEGYVYVPLTTQNFGKPHWVTDDMTALKGDGVLDLDDIMQLNIMFEPIKSPGFGDGIIYFDEVFVSGKALKGLEVKDMNRLGGEHDQVNVPKASMPENLLVSDVLVAKETVSDAAVLDAVKASVKDGKMDYIYAFNFNVTDATDLKPITFAGKVTGTTVLPEDLDVTGSKLYLYSNGALKEISYTVADGVLSMESDAFGTMVFAKAASTGGGNTSGGNDDNKPGEELPTTGVAAGAGVLVLAMLSGAGILVSRKRRSH